MYKCTVCGYIHDGDAAPERCPKCNAPQEKFEALSEDIKGLVLKSRRTNDIHMELIRILNKADELAKEGIEINLDPGCLAIFEKLHLASHQLKQSIKAEIQGHISKSKWG